MSEVNTMNNSNYANGIPTKQREQACKDIREGLQESSVDFSADEISNVASAVESAVYNNLMGVSDSLKEYRQKILFLKMRLKGKMNAKARAALLQGKIHPEEFAEMTSKNFTESFFAERLNEKKEDNSFCGGQNTSGYQQQKQTLHNNDSAHQSQHNSFYQQQQQQQRSQPHSLQNSFIKEQQQLHPEQKQLQQQQQQISQRQQQQSSQYPQQTVDAHENSQKIQISHNAKHTYVAQEEHELLGYQNQLNSLSQSHVVAAPQHLPPPIPPRTQEHKQELKQYQQPHEEKLTVEQSEEQEIQHHEKQQDDNDQPQIPIQQEDYFQQLQGDLDLQRFKLPKDKKHTQTHQQPSNASPFASFPVPKPSGSGQVAHAQSRLAGRSRYINPNHQQVSSQQQTQPQSAVSTELNNSQKHCILPPPATAEEITQLQDQPKEESIDEKPADKMQLNEDNRQIHIKGHDPNEIFENTEEIERKERRNTVPDIEDVVLQNKLSNEIEITTTMKHSDNIQSHHILLASGIKTTEGEQENIVSQQKEDNQHECLQAITCNQQSEQQNQQNQLQELKQQDKSSSRSCFVSGELNSSSLQAELNHVLTGLQELDKLKDRVTVLEEVQKEQQQSFLSFTQNSLHVGQERKGDPEEKLLDIDTQRRLKELELLVNQFVSENQILKLKLLHSEEQLASTKEQLIFQVNQNSQLNSQLQQLQLQSTQAILRFQDLQLKQTEQYHHQESSKQSTLIPKQTVTSAQQQQTYQSAKVTEEHHETVEKSEEQNLKQQQQQQQGQYQQKELKQEVNVAKQYKQQSQEHLIQKDQIQKQSTQQKEDKQWNNNQRNNNPPTDKQYSSPQSQLKPQVDSQFNQNTQKETNITSTIDGNANNIDAEDFFDSLQNINCSKQNSTRNVNGFNKNSVPVSKPDNHVNVSQQISQNNGTTGAFKTTGVFTEQSASKNLTQQVNPPVIQQQKQRRVAKGLENMFE